MSKQEEEEFVTLTDEQGKEHQFAVIDVIDVEGQSYAVLLPADSPALSDDESLDEDEIDEAIILRIDKDESGEDILVDIEDDEEWERVTEAWEELLDQEAGDEDEEGEEP